VALAAGVLLAGCAPADPAAALLADYRTRVLRVLDADDVAPAVAAPSAWPRPRARTLPIPDQRVDLIEFLSLHACDLGALVGERSSPLGRVMVPSQRLRYELRFLARAAACDPGDADAAAELDAIVNAKRAALPPVLWNATIGDPALAHHLALDVGPLDPERAAGAGREAIGALRRLAARVDDPAAARPEAADWEAPWEVLASDRYGGRVRRSAALLSAELTTVAAALEASEAERPLCPQGRPTPDARVLETVFTRYYAAAVQPYMAAVEPAFERWLAALGALRTAQPAQAPPGFDAAVAGLLPPPERAGEAVGDERAALRRARVRHTEAWQALLDRCGLGPQRP
jgi:hypothetical protein